MQEILIAIVHSGWDEGMMEQDVLSPKSVLENEWCNCYTTVEYQIDTKVARKPE